MIKTNEVDEVFNLFDIRSYRTVFQSFLRGLSLLWDRTKEGTKDAFKVWLREEIMEEYWEVIDSLLSQKNHSKRIIFVNGRYYEIVRRYKARRSK